MGEAPPLAIARKQETCLGVSQKLSFSNADFLVIHFYSSKTIEDQPVEKLMLFLFLGLPVKSQSNMRIIAVC
ncbi:MAG: hypothetical protein KME30_08095 [Iphinoe sp. HA4291-MV1]|jgi:hypothetical protein|nr:hypothetical protein [Iphinoe sp. HA4291-MV1]